MRRTRICILIAQYDPGSLAGMDAQSFKDILETIGCDVTIVAARLNVPLSNTVQLLSDCTKLCRHAEALVYYCLGSWPAGEEVVKRSQALCIVRYFGAPQLVRELHRNYSKDYTRACDAAVASATRMMSLPGVYTLPVSAAGRAECIRMGADPERCAVAFPFHCSERLADASQEEALPVVSPGAVNILAVGNIVPHRRHDLLLEAFAAYRRNFEDKARLLVVGSTPSGLERYAAYLSFLARHLGVYESVTFTGVLNHRRLRSLYRSASIAMGMSEYEPFPTYVPQALIMSTPVIAWAAGAIPELLPEGGLVLSDCEPLLFACYLSRVVEEPTIRDELRSKGLKVYDEKLATNMIRAAAIGTLSRWIQ